MQELQIKFEKLKVFHNEQTQFEEFFLESKYLPKKNVFQKIFSDDKPSDTLLLQYYEGIEKSRQSWEIQTKKITDSIKNKSINTSNLEEFLVDLNKLQETRLYLETQINQRIQLLYGQDPQKILQNWSKTRDQLKFSIKKFLYNLPLLQHLEENEQIELSTLIKAIGEKLEMLKFSVNHKVIEPITEQSKSHLVHEKQIKEEQFLDALFFGFPLLKYIIGISKPSSQMQNQSTEQIEQKEIQSNLDQTDKAINQLFPIIKGFNNVQEVCALLKEMQIAYDLIARLKEINDLKNKEEIKKTIKKEHSVLDENFKKINTLITTSLKLQQTINLFSVEDLQNSCGFLRMDDMPTLQSLENHSKSQYILTQSGHFIFYDALKKHITILREKSNMGSVEWGYFVLFLHNIQQTENLSIQQLQIINQHTKHSPKESWMHATVIHQRLTKKILSLQENQQKYQNAYLELKHKNSTIEDLTNLLEIQKNAELQHNSVSHRTDPLYLNIKSHNETLTNRYNEEKRGLCHELDQEIKNAKNLIRFRNELLGMSLIYLPKFGQKTLLNSKEPSFKDIPLEHLNKYPILIISNVDGVLYYADKWTQTVTPIKKSERNGEKYQELLEKVKLCTPKSQSADTSTLTLIQEVASRTQIEKVEFIKNAGAVWIESSNKNLPLKILKESIEKAKNSLILEEKFITIAIKDELIKNIMKPIDAARLEADEIGSQQNLNKFEDNNPAKKNLQAAYQHCVLKHELLKKKLNELTTELPGINFKTWTTEFNLLVKETNSSIQSLKEIHEDAQEIQKRLKSPLWIIANEITDSLEKEIENIKKKNINDPRLTDPACDLLHILQPPKKINFETIKDRLNKRDAVLKINDKLYFFNFLKQKVTEIKQTKENKEDYLYISRYCSLILNEALPNNLQIINRLTGRRAALKEMQIAFQDFKKKYIPESGSPTKENNQYISDYDYCKDLIKISKSHFQNDQMEHLSTGARFQLTQFIRINILRKLQAFFRGIAEYIKRPSEFYLMKTDKIPTLKNITQQLENKKELSAMILYQKNHNDSGELYYFNKKENTLKKIEVDPKYEKNHLKVNNLKTLKLLCKKIYSKNNLVDAKDMIEKHNEELNTQISKNLISSVLSIQKPSFLQTIGGCRTEKNVIAQGTQHLKKLEKVEAQEVESMVL